MIELKHATLMSTKHFKSKYNHSTVNIHAQCTKYISFIGFNKIKRLKKMYRNSQKNITDELHGLDEITKSSTNGIKQFESKYSHSTVNIQLQTVNTVHWF